MGKGEEWPKSEQQQQKITISVLISKETLGIEVGHHGEIGSFTQKTGRNT